MSSYSGKDGTIWITGNEVSPIGNWKYRETSNNPAWADNTTAGVKTRVAGVKDSSGSFEFVLESTETLPLDIGDTAILILDIDGTETNTITVPVIIDEIGEIECDINDGEKMMVPYTWSGTGAATKAGVLAVATGGSGS